MPVDLCSCFHWGLHRHLQDLVVLLSGADPIAASFSPCREVIFFQKPQLQIKIKILDMKPLNYIFSSAKKTDYTNSSILSFIYFITIVILTIDYISVNVYDS